MLQKPAFKYNEDKDRRCVCLVNGHYHVYLTRDAAIDLLHGLYWFATERPYGEEVDIWSDGCEELPSRGKLIGLCELNLVPAHKHKKQGKNILKEPRTLPNEFHGVYDAKNDRLDYFISPDEAAEAYQAVTALMTDDASRGKHEVTLFGTLLVKLVSA